MKDASDVSCLVVDNGLFLPVAHRLSQFYKRVLYHRPNAEAFPTLQKGCVGDGFEAVECCRDPWPLIDKGEIDLAVFPDLLNSGWQLHLERLGIAVWGSRQGDSIELSREKFLSTLKQCGLECPKYERIVGLSALMAHLIDKEDKYIKISRWRGSMETWHWRSWALDQDKLFAMGLKFGPLREYVPFLVFDPIETDIEDGGDFIGVDGEWLPLCLRGIESKDKGYFSSVTKLADLPDYQSEILEVFGQVLKPYRYRNLFSVEIRVKDNKAFFIDPCARGPLPASGSQMMVWDNIGEIIWAGAHGEVVEPEPAAKFTAECVLTMKGEKHEWRSLEWPEELRSWMKIPDSCLVDDVLGIPPDDSHGEEIGWLVALGDTPTETIETLKDHASKLPEGVDAHLEALVDLVQEAEAMRAEGIPITQKAMPEPAEVVEKT